MMTMIELIGQELQWTQPHALRIRGLSKQSG